MKNFIIMLLKSLLKVFYVFPIKKDRIIFSSYSGKNYSCNPKYITEWLVKNCADDIDIIWAFNEPDKIDLENDKIQKVKYKSIIYLYYMLTAHVVVDNVESWSILPKRKGQVIINTWHGGGAYKGVGLQRRDTTSAIDRNMLSKNKRVTLYISSSTAFTNQTLRESFLYKGEILEIGMPRNDLFFGSSEEQVYRLKKKIGLPDGYKFIIYAPTFRKDNNYRYMLDYEAIINAFSKRFGGKWIILQRAHYYLTSEVFDDDICIDVSNYSDMQELLLISDALITDYSSSIWDYSLTNKPGFLYTPDLDYYLKERAFYTPIDEWPYEYAETEQELESIIQNYDPIFSSVKIKNHLEKLGSKESGNASKLIGEYILQFLVS